MEFVAINIFGISERSEKKISLFLLVVDQDSLSKWLYKMVGSHDSRMRTIFDMNR